MLLQKITETAWTLSQEMYDKGKFSDCLSVREHLLTAMQHVFGHEHTDVAAGLDNIGVVYRDLGKLPEALAKHDEALRIRRSKLGDNHMAVAGSVINIGATLREMGDLQGALKKAAEGIRIVEKQASRRHLYVAEALNDQGVALQLLGRPVEAVAKCEEAVGVYSQLLDSDSPDVLTARVCLAVALFDAGRVQEAKVIHDELAPACEDLHGLALQQFDALRMRLSSE